MPTGTVQASPLKYARAAGFLLLLSIVAGGFGEAYAPSQIMVAADAAATARNLLASAWLFRLDFASYLVEAICDVGLALLFYELLGPVRKDLSLLAAFFNLVGAAIFVVAELFYLAPTLILGALAT